MNYEIQDLRSVHTHYRTASTISQSNEFGLRVTVEPVGSLGIEAVAAHVVVPAHATLVPSSLDLYSVLAMHNGFRATHLLTFRSQTSHLNDE